MDALGQLVLHLAGSPLVLPLVFLFVLIDALFPPVPSESVVIALAAVSVSTGHPSLPLLAAAAGLGAFLGDNLTYEIGRRIGVARFAWMRRGWFARIVAKATAALEHRVSSAVLAARFVPGGRVGVNLVAGATGIRRTVFRPLALLSSACWTAYMVIIGAVAGAWVREHPAVGALVAAGLGLLVGLLIDTALGIIRRRRQFETYPHPVTTPKGFRAWPSTNSSANPLRSAHQPENDHGGGGRGSSGWPSSRSAS